MALSFTNTAGGTGYSDIRVGSGHGIHQMKLVAASLAASRDSDGYLPPGLPVAADGSTVGAAEDAYGIIGPDPVLLGDADIFGNVILTGPIQQNMIEDNLGRVLSADELAGIASGMPQIRLV